MNVATCCGCRRLECSIVVGGFVGSHSLKRDDSFLNEPFNRIMCVVESNLELRMLCVVGAIESNLRTSIRVLICLSIFIV